LLPSAQTLGVVKALRLEVNVRRLFLGLAAVAVLAAIVWLGSRVMPADKPARSVPSQAFVWSDRIPLNEAMLTKWLRAHGATYAVWAKRHPAAAQRLAGANAANP
jgi:hypothetical protein